MFMISFCFYSIWNIHIKFIWYDNSFASFDVKKYIITNEWGNRNKIQFNGEQINLLSKPEAEKQFAVEDPFNSYWNRKLG